jgi:hypothetical protein
MTKFSKLLARVLRGASDSDISFAELCQMLHHLGFDERISGDHHIFTRADIKEILNLQTQGSKAKPYQIRQVRNVIVDYKLGDEDDPL